MTRHMWILVLLISLGGWFDTYSIFLTVRSRRACSPIRSSPYHGRVLWLQRPCLFHRGVVHGLFIGALFLSRFADRFGRRTVFTYSLVAYSGLRGRHAFQSTAETINLWRMLAGIGIASNW